MNLEAKLKQLLEERENLLVEMDEIQKAYNLRQQRLIELVGAIKTVQELMQPEENDKTTQKETPTEK